MRHVIQCTGAMQHVPELLCKPNQLVLQGQAPSLAKIMAAHEQGRPIDASLMRDLPYNDIENNPFLEKGIDLADLPKIARQLDSDYKDLQTAMENEKLAKQTAKGPDNSEAPESVPTE